MADSAPRPISEIADKLGVAAEHVIPYGHDKAKIELEALESGRDPGRLVLVSAITPTSAGEGKTTTSISLAQGLATIGESVCLALREPSLGPIFGIKGGAIGGGKTRVVPSEDINMHFTGDFHAITSTNNLLAAILDNHLHHGNKLGLDPRRVLWRRVVDLNDRALRNVTVGLGGPTEGVPRETGFDITPASEIMAILCLSKGEDDLRQRLGRILVGLNYDREPVTAGDLNAVGGMMALLKDAIKPNLVQTLEGVPAVIHGGPFANIAHGCNSVLATRMAMAHADWTLTEAGFGFDLGGEKFFDIKCRTSGLNPSAVVLVATVRALKRHGGVPNKELETPDVEAVERGLPNLERHLESLKVFGKPVVVAINRFTQDSDEELAAVRRACERYDVPVGLNDGFVHGGEGAADLARVLVEHAQKEPSPLQTTYELTDPVKEKAEKVAKRIYGADGIDWSGPASRAATRCTDMGYGELPLCMAKTQMSLSDDPKRAGRPEGFRIAVRDMIVSAGAGFLIPLVGNLMRMPGLPRSPQSERMDLKDGKIIGMT